MKEFMGVRQSIPSTIPHISTPIIDRGLCHAQPITQISSINSPYTLYHPNPLQQPPSAIHTTPLTPP